MKAKKREFLARRKSRKKAKSIVPGAEKSESDISEDLEDAIMRDKHRPAFGEQALQPLKVIRLK